jgi:hypothetical protein
LTAIDDVVMRLPVFPIAISGAARCGAEQGVLAMNLEPMSAVQARPHQHFTAQRAALMLMKAARVRGRMARTG